MARARWRRKIWTPADSLTVKSDRQEPWRANTSGSAPEPVRQRCTHCGWKFRSANVWRWKNPSRPDRPLRQHPPPPRKTDPLNSRVEPNEFLYFFFYSNDAIESFMYTERGKNPLWRGIPVFIYIFRKTKRKQKDKNNRVTFWNNWSFRIELHFDDNFICVCVCVLPWNFVFRICRVANQFY